MQSNERARFLNFDVDYIESSIEQDSDSEDYIFPFEIAAERTYRNKENCDLDSTLFIFQINLVTYWENKFVNPIKSKARIVDSEGNFSTGNLLDYIDIHRYTMKAGLSNSEGNSLLALIQKICIRHSARITIPTDMRAINAAITNSSESHHSCPILWVC